MSVAATASAAVPPPSPEAANAQLMDATPEVVLFVGGAVVSVVLIAAVLWFWVKISKQESQAERERPRGGA